MSLRDEVKTELAKPGNESVIASVDEKSGLVRTFLVPTPPRQAASQQTRPTSRIGERDVTPAHERPARQAVNAQEYLEPVPYFAKQSDGSQDGGVQTGALSPTDVMRLEQERDDLARQLQRSGLSQGARVKAEDRLNEIETVLKNAREADRVQANKDQRTQERPRQTGAAPSVTHVKGEFGARIIDGKRQRMITSDRGIGMWVDA
jgi:hypothetical protein